MKEILQKLTAHLTLDREEAKAVLMDIGTGKYGEAQVAAFLTVFMMRLVTVEELAGFRDALLELCLFTDLSEYNAIDLCGTGGDGKNTFNISTLSAFVVAGGGVNVAKHGNYGVSSACGSSNVMEYLGYKFTNKKDELKRQLDRAGICFLHAPLFHPAMKNVGPVRKALGVKTFFNMLGPLVNPSNPPNQLAGVFSLETARLYNYIFQQTEKKYAVIYSLDGYDEISLTGDFKMISNDGEKLLAPDDVGFRKYEQEDLSGGDTIADSARIFISILEGNGTDAQNDAVIVNSGMAFRCVFPERSHDECFEMSRESLFGGKALKVLKTLTEVK